MVREVAPKRAAQGLRTPAVDDAPQVADEWAEYWLAFLDLSGARSSGWVADPIPVSEVEAWCRVNRIGVWRHCVFWRVVHGLDSELQRLNNSKEKASANAAASD